mmetsp:Transcript_73628/g.157947  ORF Transcript_73628/g.157947 Transcript_73628/m.157947 type:complete len:308 (+) Transcript_73628:453-1376(+)
MGDHVRRQVGPVLALVLAINGIREGEVLNFVRHIGHPRIQILITAPRHELQMAGNSGHDEAALGIAAPLEGLMMRRPAVGLHLDRPLDPSDDVRLIALAIEEREAPVRLVKADRGVRVDALILADFIEVDTVHPDKAHCAQNAIAIGELLGLALPFAVHLLGDLVPSRGELLAMAAPSSEEIDHGEVVTLDHLVKALVGEAVVRAGPICVQLRCSDLLLEFLHLALVLTFGFLLVRCDLLGLDRHAEGLALLIYGAQPEVLGHRVKPFLGGLGVHDDLQISAFDVVQVDIEVDLQIVGVLAVQHQHC